MGALSTGRPHEAIFGAIAARDGERAGRAMQDHLETVVRLYRHEQTAG